MPKGLPECNCDSFPISLLLFPPALASLPGCTLLEKLVPIQRDAAGTGGRRPQRCRWLDRPVTGPAWTAGYRGWAMCYRGLPASSEGLAGRGWSWWWFRGAVTGRR